MQASFTASMCQPVYAAGACADPQRSGRPYEWTNGGWQLRVQSLLRSPRTGQRLERGVRLTCERVRLLKFKQRLRSLRMDCSESVEQRSFGQRRRWIFQHLGRWGNAVFLAKESC